MSLLKLQGILPLVIIFISTVAILANNKDNNVSQQSQYHCNWLLSNVRYDNSGTEYKMEHLWAPWRAEYILQTEKAGCFLCEKPKETNDETNLILHRGKSNFVILNSFPYNPGHLLVAPYRHVGNLDALTDEEAKEHFELVKLSLRLLTEVTKPAGFNMGMNLGKVAGAGLDDHLHTHIVPRWQGDTNFMPVISNTKVLSEALAASYKKLKDGLRIVA